MIVPIAVLAVVFMSTFRDDIRPDEGGTFDSGGRCSTASGSC